MAIAYSVLAHQHPEQFERLVRLIAHPDDFIALHIDSRAPTPMHLAARRLLDELPNVALIPSRPVLWGGYRMIEAQIEGIEMALNQHLDWTHYINLSGQDFPLKTRPELLARLEQNPDKSFVRWFDPLRVPVWSNAQDRVARLHIESLTMARLFKLPWLGRRLRQITGPLPYIPFYRRNWPDFFQYFGGSNHVVLSRAAARYVARDPDARRITQWLRYAAHANEIIFPSVLMNSRFRDSIINDHLREIEFAPHAANPVTFTTADAPRLLSSPQFFARKFDMDEDSQILDILEAHLRGTRQARRKGVLPGSCASKVAA